MRRLCTAICLLPALLGSCAAAHGETWPRLAGAADGPCAEALEIARISFASAAFHPYAVAKTPENAGSVLLVKPRGLDLSGGDALDIDAAAFDKLPIGGTVRNLYWMKRALHGYRLVLLDAPVGWRGDMYALYTIEEKVSPERFATRVRSEQELSKLAAIVSDRWRPPLVLQDTKRGPPWVIDVGQPYEFLADWQVFVAGPDGLKQRCTVRFRPEAAKAVDLLPPAVRELERLLDATIGPGTDEGTLQSTAGIRLQVQHTWANAALRPWAMGAPYNTRAEVDEGLKRWSTAGAAHRKLHEDIQRQYPLAERALAQYYGKQFQRSRAEADEAASYVLDVALRSHYVFSSDDPMKHSRDSNARANPWRRPAP